MGNRNQYPVNYHGTYLKIWQNLYYVLGSKIDNIYDVLDKVEQELK